MSAVPSSTSPDWQLTYVLPNLNLGRAFEAMHIALVPPNDPRLAPIRAASPQATKLLDGFTNSRGGKVEPSALLIARDAPANLKDGLVPLVAFRNAVAAAIMLRGWAGIRPHMGGGTWPFSDYFDFYPTLLGRTGELLTYTPAVLSPRLSGAPFFGMPHAHMSKPFNPKPPADSYLLHACLRLWERRFVRSSVDDRFTRVLFRSLETAYQASTTPFRNHGLTNDYGIAIALWVSACEILAHPKPRVVTPYRPAAMKVNLRRVLDLLGSFQWHDARLSRQRYQVVNWKAIHPSSLIQYLYGRLYAARNDFLHGNALGARVLDPFPRGRISRPSIVMFAPIVYRTALYAYLSRKVSPNFGGWMEEMIRLIELDSYQDCLLQLVERRKVGE